MGWVMASRTRAPQHSGWICGERPDRVDGRKRFSTPCTFRAVHLSRPGDKSESSTLRLDTLPCSNLCCRNGTCRKNHRPITKDLVKRSFPFSSHIKNVFCNQFTQKGRFVDAKTCSWAALEVNISGVLNCTSSLFCIQTSLSSQTSLCHFLLQHID